MEWRDWIETRSELFFLIFLRGCTCPDGTTECPLRCGRAKELLWSEMSRGTGRIVWWMRSRAACGRTEQGEQIEKSNLSVEDWATVYVSIGDDFGIRFSRASSCWLQWRNIVGAIHAIHFPIFCVAGIKRLRSPRFVTRRRMDLEREIEISRTIYYFPLPLDLVAKDHVILHCALSEARYLIRDQLCIIYGDVQDAYPSRTWV